MTSTTTTSAGQAGGHTARDLITALADAGLGAGRIDRAAEDVLAARHDHPTPISDWFDAEFDRTAAIYVAELRGLEAG